MRRLLAAMAILVLLGAGCAQGEQEHAQTTGGQPAPRIITERYAWKQNQLDFCRDVLQMLRDVLYFEASWGHTCYLDNEWTLTQQRTWYGPGGSFYYVQLGDDGSTTGTGYGEANITYSKGTVTSDPLDLRAGQTDIVDNGGDSEIEHEISRSVTLEKSVESTLDQTFTREEESGVEEEVKGGVPFGGPELDTELSEKIGISLSTDKSQTTANSTSTTQEVSDKVTIPAGKKYMISLANQHLTEAYTLSMDAELVWGKIIVCGQSKDGGIKVFGGAWDTMNHQDNPGWAGNSWSVYGSCVGWADLPSLVETFQGTNTDWPRMNAWYGTLSDEQKERIAGMLDKEYRLTLTGDQIRRSQSATSLIVHDVTGCDDDILDKFHSTTGAAQPASNIAEKLPCAVEKVRRPAATRSGG